MRRWLGLLCLGAMLSAMASLAQAESLIVGADELERLAQRGALVWDARGVRDYAAGHIPGAVNIGDAGEVFRDPQREDPRRPRWPRACSARPAWTSWAAT